MYTLPAVCVWGIAIQFLTTLPLKRIFFKMFKTGSSDIVSQCQEFFNFSDVSELIFRRKRKFNKRFTASDNLLCDIVKSKFQTVDWRCSICRLSTVIWTLLVCVHVYVLCVFYSSASADLLWRFTNSICMYLYLYLYYVSVFVNVCILF